MNFASTGFFSFLSFPKKPDTVGIKIFLILLPVAIMMTPFFRPTRTSSRWAAATN